MPQTRQEYVSNLRHLTDMRELVRSTCRSYWGADTEPAIAELELAVTEAASNIIRHAHRGMASLPIEMVIEADPEQVSVTLYHSGPAFDPASAPPPVFNGSREGGFGLYLIRQSVDDVRYWCDEQGRQAIRLLKRHP